MQERAFIPHGMPGGVCACAPTGGPAVFPFSFMRLCGVGRAPVGAYRIRPRSYPAAGWGVRRRWRRLKGVCDTPLPGMRGGIINNYQLWGEPRRGVSAPRMAQSEPHFGVSDTRMLKSEPRRGVSDTQKLKSEPHFGVSDTRKLKSEPHFGVPTPGSPAATLIWGYPNCSGV